MIKTHNLCKIVTCWIKLSRSLFQYNQRRIHAPESPITRSASARYITKDDDMRKSTRGLPRWKLSPHTAKPGQVTPRTTYTYGNGSAIHYQREEIVQRTNTHTEDTLCCKNEEHLPLKGESSCRLLYSSSWKVRKWRRIVLFLRLIQMLVAGCASFRTVITASHNSH